MYCSHVYCTHVFGTLPWVGGLEEVPFAHTSVWQPLRFGSYVNLVHATSLKFLTKTSNPASAEPQCHAMALYPVPTIDAYFRVLPQFKSSSFGDLVYVGDTVYLQCCGGVTSDFFLRATSKLTVDPNEDFVEDKFANLAEPRRAITSSPIASSPPPPQPSQSE